ncbi:MAG: cytochrome c [Proteobacteria bacterium]|nr:cytochrome c [Pseudomonadota bacterium]
MLKLINVLAPASATLMATLSVAVAQNAPPSPEKQAEKAVEIRQGLFNVQGFAFGPVGAMLKGAAPVDAALVQKEAARVQMTSSMITEVFKLDTRKFQTRTKAKDKIWTDQQDFAQKANDLHEAAVVLEAAARKGDKSGILDAAGKVGNACKACHDEYREK